MSSPGRARRRKTGRAGGRRSTRRKRLPNSENPFCFWVSFVASVQLGDHVDTEGTRPGLEKYN